MERGGADGSASGLVDAADRRFVESLPPGAERETVVASLARHRAPEALQVGDARPGVTVRRAENLEAVALAELVRARPLLLVFGSFT